MVDFVKYIHRDSVVDALALTAVNQATIIETSAEDVAAGKITKLSLELAKPTDETYTFTFKYKTDSTEQVLREGDYLVKLSNSKKAYTKTALEAAYRQTTENDGLILDKSKLSS